MAYVTKYRVLWTNEKFQDVEILFKKKDGVPGPVQDYAAISVKLSRNGTEGKFMAISGASLTIEFDMRATDIDYWGDFVTALKDTWMVVATVGAVAYFSGFVLADEGSVPFMDKPYNAKITAVDNIGLLKEIDLTRMDGTYFNSHHSVIEYIVACLYQTGLDLPIMVYDNFFHTSFLNRNNDFKHDFVSQAYVEYRTFQKDAVTFLDCYSVLEKIFKNNFRLFQCNGYWVIIRLGMLQYIPGTGYYTIYDHTGHNQVGYEMTENYATVGKRELIFPCREDQQKYLKKGIKFSKTIYNYSVWPEIPKNNKFERGEVIASGSATKDDLLLQLQDQYTKPPYTAGQVIGTYENTSIEDWQFGMDANGGIGEIVIQPATQIAYRKIVKDVYLNTLDDKIVLQAQVFALYLKSEGVPINAGDKVNLSFSVALQRHIGTGRFTVARVNLVAYDHSVIYDLQMDGLWETSDPEAFWLYSEYATGVDNRHMIGVSVQSNPAPVAGTLYIALVSRTEPEIYFKDFSFSVSAFVAGSFRPLKGEYWKFTQDGQDFVDKSEEEVFLSDATHKIFKGCFLNSTGAPLTADWYRMGLAEHKAYNQLTNYNKFQLEQRRYLLIEGTFDGLFSAADNNRLNPLPVGLHTQYRFSDIPGMDQRFILGVPMEANLDTCEFTALFSEVFIDDPAFADGVMTGTEEYKYIF